MLLFWPENGISLDKGATKAAIISEPVAVFPSSWLIAQCSCGRSLHFLSDCEVTNETDLTFQDQFWVSLPNIGADGEDAVLQRLWWHPADGEKTFASFSVVIGLVYVSGHAKV